MMLTQQLFIVTHVFDGAWYNHQRHREMFPASAPLQFPEMYMVVPFPKKTEGNQILIFITNSYSKITRVTPVVKTAAPHVVEVSINSWIIPYGRPTHLLTYNGTQFVSKF